MTTIHPLCERRHISGCEDYDTQILYFTCSSLSQDDCRLYLLSDRDGSPNVIVRDLLTGRERILTRNRSGYLKSYVYFDGTPGRGLGKASVCLDSPRDLIYYIQDNQICRTDLQGQTTVLGHIPDGRMTAFTHVSADGRLLCVPMTDGRCLDFDPETEGYGLDKRPRYNIDGRIRQENLSSYLCVYDTATGELLYEKQVPRCWITHVQFNPVRPELIMFNHEWPEQDCGIRRIWLYDHATDTLRRVRTEGEMPGRYNRSRHDWVCHEMWSDDGRYIVYHGGYADGGPAFVGRADTQDFSCAECVLPDDYNAYGHFLMMPGGDLVCDGYFKFPEDIKPVRENSTDNGPDPHKKDAEYISRVHPDWQTRTLTWMPLCKHGTDWLGQDSHPHPVCNHRGDTIYFSARSGRKVQVYAVAATPPQLLPKEEEESRPGLPLSVAEMTGRLSPMQQSVLRSDRPDRDMTILAPTGSGKTLAVLLSLRRLLDPGSERVQALIMTPSRELALQTQQVFRTMGGPLRIMSCYGGRPAMEEHRTMQQLRPAVIAGTPGRLNDHLAKGNIRAEEVGILIIDEFDKCLELGFRDEMAAVITRLTGLRKRYLLSATDGEVPPFVGMRPNGIRVDYLRQKELVTAGRLSQWQVKSPEKDKLQTLRRLLCSFGGRQAIVFANHRDAAERIAGYLRREGLWCTLFHGGMEQEERERALGKFRNGSCHTLVATDLAARGLDIPATELIVHYHLPLDEETLLHRNGRTARWQATGQVCYLTGPEEQLPPCCGELSEWPLPATLPAPVPPRRTTLYIGRGRKEKLSRADVAGFLCKQGGLTGDEIGLIEVRDHYALAAIDRDRLKQTLTRVKGKKIKGIKTIFEEMRD